MDGHGTVRRIGENAEKSEFYYIIVKIKNSGKYNI